MATASRTGPRSTKTKTNPRKLDTDGDGLSDWTEVYKTKTNPRKLDTDGDGYGDGVEVQAGTNPLDPKSHPTSTKTRPPVEEPKPPAEEPTNVLARAAWTAPANAQAGKQLPLDGTGSTGDAPMTCTWSFENQDGSVVWQTQSGCSIAFTFSEAGTKYVKLTVNDANGETDSNKQELTVSPPPDTAPPETTITAGPSGTTTSTSASFSFDSSESGSSFACKLDEGSYGSCTSPKAYSGLSLGSHTFSVRATDAAGNTDATPATRTWTVESAPADTTPPETTITSGPSGETSETSASFSFDSSESGSSFACKLDEGSYGSCTSPKAYSGLSLGSHTFSVRATDAAGNTDATPATRTWTVESGPADTTPPETTISSGPSGETSETSASFSFDSSESGSSFACKLDEGSYGSCTSPKAYSGLSLGSHTFSVRATDAAGNTDATPATRTWTVTTTTPPVEGSHCFSSPHACGYPDPTNTGVPAGTTLTPSGNINVTTAGTMIKNLDVTGSINIAANNVTVENTRVTLNGSGCGPTNTCGNYEIRINEGVTGTVIKDTELRTASGTTCEHDIRNTSGPGLKIIRVYMHGCDSNLYGGATMTDSYGIAKLAISSDHVENIYFDDTSFTAIHDTLLNPISQTAVIFGNSNGGTDTTNCRNQLTVKNSLLGGGGYSLYPCAHSSNVGSSTLDVEGNHFGRCTTSEKYNPNGGEHTCSGGPDSNGYYPNSGAFGIATNYYKGTGVWKGNVWDDNLAAFCIDGKAGCS